MATAAPERCPSCGAERPAGAPLGLCPRCLLRGGLDSGLMSLSDAGELGATVDLSGSPSVLERLDATVGPVPRVLLRDPANVPEPPVHRPASPEVPDAADRSPRLRLLGEISRGGMGAVLKGRDEDLGRDLAVKVLLEKHRDDPNLIRRFVEEAQIGGQLQHPGIVPIYELGSFGDRRPYFAMKLVKGQTLAKLLAARPSPADGLARFLGIFEQVCQTVAYAHARGVIHRDLKPSNVMVGSFGEVQVMDWGLAKVLDRGGVADDRSAGRLDDAETLISTARSGSDSDLSHAGSILGTPAYMAPEQALGEVDLIDERADVFALGSILCEILTGSPAFTGRSSAEIQRLAARADTADALSRLDASGTDLELIALGRSCLAADPDSRPRDAGAVADRLTSYLSGVQERLRAAELERAAEAARAEEAQARAAVERSRRRRTVALAAALLALTTLGGLTFTYALQQRQARLSAAERVLSEAEILLGQARVRVEDPAGWQAALAALKQVDEDSLPPKARGRLAALREEIEAGTAAAEADQALLAELLDIRSIGVVASNSSPSPEGDDGQDSASDAAYAATFRAAGYDIDAIGPEAVAAMIRSRPQPVALALVAALDDWASRRRRARPGTEAAWKGLVAVARAADPDPRRNELRAIWELADRTVQLGPLHTLAAEADVDTWPAPTLNLLAVTLQKAGDIEAAVALLRRVVISHPCDVTTNVNLGRLLASGPSSRIDEAIRYYTAVRALRPEMAYFLAQVLKTRGDTDEAIEVYRGLVQRRPEDVRHRVQLAQILRSAGRGDEARAEFEGAVAVARAVVARHPGDPRAHTWLGHALYHHDLTHGLDPNLYSEPARRSEIQAVQDRHDEAIAAYREAVRLAPEDAQLRMGLGGVLESRRGMKAEAIAAYRQAVRIDPDLGMAHVGLGHLLRRQGETAEAVWAFRQAARILNNAWMIREEYATALAFNGELGEAESELREALRLKPDEAKIHYALFLVLLRQKKPAEAAAAFREAIRFDPRFPLVYGTSYHFLEGLGQPDQDRTIADYREAIRLRPELPEPYIVLGKALGRLRRFDEAVDAYREAARLWPDHDLPRLRLAAILASRGELSEAVAAYREAIRLRPDHAEAHCDLGHTLQRAGDFAGALAALRRGHELGSKRPDWRSPSDQWVRRAEQLAALAERLKAVLSGASEPTDNAERLALAQMCYDTKRFAAAAQFWSEPLEADPALADDLQAYHRYNASCAAALAGCGKGQDDPPPDDAGRAALRQRALAWLRTDLALRADQLTSDAAKARRFLTHWTTDPDFAGVREPDALAALPEDERAEWKALWDEVGRLLEDVSGAP